jgi:hypothetical protein
MCASARSKLVVLERLVGEVGGFGTPDDAEDDPDDAPGPIVRDEEARARCMPDEAVAREVSRPLLDNTAGTTTWFDAGEPGCGGDLTRKRSVRSFQPEFAGQQGWCGRAGGCSGWWERLGTVHDHLSAGGVLAGEDEQGARQGRGLAGVDSEPGDDRPD